MLSAMRTAKTGWAAWPNATRPWARTARARTRTARPRTRTAWPHAAWTGTAWSHAARAWTRAAWPHAARTGAAWPDAAGTAGARAASPGGPAAGSLNPLGTNFVDNQAAIAIDDQIDDRARGQGARRRYGAVAADNLQT